MTKNFEPMMMLAVAMAASVPAGLLAMQPAAHRKGEPSPSRSGKKTKADLDQIARAEAKRARRNARRIALAG